MIIHTVLIILGPYNIYIIYPIVFKKKSLHFICEVETINHFKLNNLIKIFI
jgi:hypothetical protein